jgi:hypothetical protein
MPRLTPGESRAFSFDPFLERRSGFDSGLVFPWCGAHIAGNIKFHPFDQLRIF